MSCGRTESEGMAHCEAGVVLIERAGGEVPSCTSSSGAEGRAWVWRVRVVFSPSGGEAPGKGGKVGQDEANKVQERLPCWSSARLGWEACGAFQ